MNETRNGDRRLRKLLFATDRSAGSRAALLAVAGLAVGGETRVVVLHVDDSGQPQEGRRLVGEMALGLISLAVDARPELREAAPGRAAEKIAAAAAEHGADLVVLGSRGRSDLGGMRPGRVAREVLERASCPVLVVRAGRRTAGRRRRVLVAVGGGDSPTQLVRTTAAVAERDARVLVLHLLEPGGSLQPAPSEELVERVVAGLRRCRVRVREATLTTGREIAAAALAYGADLVVMGSRRSSSA